MLRQLQLSTGVGLSVRLLPKSKSLWSLAVILLFSLPVFSQINISFDVTEPVCFGLPNGSVTATASGGIGPYVYIWSTGDFGPTLDNISAGSYNITVTDNNGNMATGGIVVGQPDQLLADLVANICSFPFSVTAFPSGGQGPYGYSWSTGAQTQTINNLPAGTYCVTITDSELCGVLECITLDATPLSVSVVTTDLTCPDGMDGQVQATPSGGTPPYALTWNTGQTGPVLQNLAPGSYTVTVTDANGCMASATGVVSNQPPIVINLNATDPTCLGDSNGSVMASASGGTPPFSYSWNTGASGQTITGLGPGTYTVTVTDSNGCEEEASTTLAPVSNLTIGAFGTHETCPNLNDGFATVTTNNGVPPYTYIWSNGGSTQVLSGLPPGTYSVTVIDNVGCSATASTVVNAAPDFEIMVTASTTSTCGTADGVVTASIITGVGPYSYMWSTGETTSSISNLGAGTYFVTVTGNNGCQVNGSATVVEPPAVSVSINATDIVCAGASDGLAEAIVTGGTPPFTYNWNTGDIGPQIMNLPAGTYSVTLTDAFGCMDMATAVIQEAPQLVLEIDGTEIVCGPENNGDAMVNASGGTPPYTYMWSTGDTEESIEGLGEGTFSVTVIDALGCIAITEIEIDVIDDFMLNITPRDVLCNGDNSGSILVLPEGGTAPYTFNWSTGDDTNEITGLPAGQYTVTVSDANGCELSETITVNEPPQLNVSTTVVDIDCFGSSNGSATVTVNGGTLPYTIEWSDGQSGPVATDLSPGTYTVSVTDANLCVEIRMVTIEEPDELMVNVSAPSIDCAGTSTGTLSPIIVGGTAPYSFQWNTGANSPTLENLPAGIYALTITDANGCTATAETITLSELPELEISFEVTDIACTNDAVGAIAASVSGGTAPYTYSWSNNATTDVISNLAAGAYFLTVTDANGCEVSGSALVIQFPGLQVIPTSTDVSCPGSADGSASVSINGGTAPFTYDWSNGADTPQIDNLSPGTYTVTVTGALGCVGEASVTIGEPTALLLQTSSIDATCAGSADGQASVMVSGGTPPYSYNWSSGSVQPTANGLTAGTYTVTVTDANGCDETATVEVGEPTPVQLLVEQLSPTCEGTTNGVATASASGGTPPYTYQWSDGQSGSTIINLPAGTYSVTATDANGCTGTGMVTIAELENPTCMVNVVSEVTTFGGSDGILEALVSGGVGPYSYLWSDGQTGQTATNLAPGTYSLTVTDANGCTTTCEGTLNGPARIGDFVWFDTDRDGIQDPGEPGIPGVTVIVTGVDEDDPPYTDTTTTDANGYYIFNVPPGTYKVTFINPDGLIPTELNAGLDDALDSDADPDMMLMTHVTTVGPNEEDLTLDAGFYTKCDNINNPGVIGGNQFLCGPGVDPDPLFSVQDPSGGTGDMEYLWMMSTIPGPFDINVWLPIPNSDSPTFDPGPLFETTYFARCARRECCTTYLESNIVTIEVGSVAVANIQGPSLVCEDEQITFYAVGNGPDAVIEWDFGPGVIPATASGSPVTISFTSFGSFEINLMVTENDCTSQDFKTITVTNNPVECGSSLAINAHITDEEAVMVTWETQYLGDEFSFDVEQSSDGENFTKIGNVTEPELSIGGMEFYQYLDVNPKIGRNYYRVKVVAPTGDYTYSEVEEAVIIGDSKLMLVYPNPMEDQLVLEIFDSFNEDISLTLVAANGVLIRKENLPADTKRKVIDVVELPAGVYFLQVTYGKTDIKTLKLLKR